ncbi:hypothetical protein BU26DRAFT_561968 [Trematosphaeria pertusa]|uniref:Uncharacterized protein n=1 Tax=Trematosphaeria pertusa TaxID=390896 RepID=A0A6A6INS9_9PLEO|nr:uncharacterized protein BU26DRAFT_561968 [Trematosphaeria pertusa]KAF2252214.1 hypothetical protein BU26DRAFT_561968 [Trematosphaeria pertusa]
MTLPFDGPEPRTYADLLARLDGQLDADDCDSIEFVSAHLHMLRRDPSMFNHSFGGDGGAEPSPQFLVLMSDVERVGVQGWVKWIEAKRKYGGAYESMRGAWSASCEEAAESRRRERELLDELEQERLARKSRSPTGLLEKKGFKVAAGLQGSGEVEKGGDADSIEQLQRLVGRLETQLNRLDGLRNAEEEGLKEALFGKLPSIPEEKVLKEALFGKLPSIPEDFEDETDDESYDGQERDEEGTTDAPTRRPRPWSGSSTIVEVGSAIGRPKTGAGISNVAVSAAAADAEYPPPLTPSVVDTADEDDRDASISREENRLWAKEEHERCNSFTFDTLSPSSHFASRESDALPNYIYIPLPADFTVPTHSARTPSLTFRTPASVFHFPHGATRDQLLRLLRLRRAADMPGPSLESPEEVNVIRVRTHVMEWELKNAIRKYMTSEEWNTTGGQQWKSEGEGVTYIVSKPDVYFSGMSKLPSSGSHEGKEQSDEGEEMEGENWHEVPQLRGGAGLSPEEMGQRHYDKARPGQQSEFISDYIVLDGIPGTNKPSSRSNAQPFDNSHQPPSPAPLYAAISTFEQTWIHYVRVLQLKNASSERLIEYLRARIKDDEETIEWQDDKLEDMFCAMEQLRREVGLAKEEAAAARMETEQLKEVMNSVNGVKGSTLEEELGPEDEREERLEYDELAEPVSWDGPHTPGMRGGGSPHQYTEDTRVPQNTADQQEPTTHEETATAFYFFPSVSIIALLGPHLRYFQWPRRTTLPQIRDILEHRHAHGMDDNNPCLRRIRDILEMREENGITLPDVQDERMVLISIPQEKGDGDDEKPGKAALWEKGFGPDEYEKLRLEALRGLNVPVANDRSHLSPPSSGEDDKFYEVGDLINAIHDQIDAALTGSDRFIYGNHESVPSPPSSSFLNPRTPPPISVRSVSSRPTPPKIPSFHFSPRPTRPSPPRRTTSAVPETSYHPHPATMPTTNPWPRIRHVRADGDELYRSANFGYELDGEKPANGIAGEEEEEELWRHARGKGCETWLGDECLERGRTRCTFCDVRFVDEEDKGSSESYGSINDPDGVPTPRTRTRRSSPKRTENISGDEESTSQKTTALNSPELSPKTIDPHLRGGANTHIHPFEYRWLDDWHTTSPQLTRRTRLSSRSHFSPDSSPSISPFSQRHTLPRHRSIPDFYDENGNALEESWRPSYESCLMEPNEPKPECKPHFWADEVGGEDDDMRWGINESEAETSTSGVGLRGGFIPPQNSALSTLQSPWFGDFFGGNVFDETYELDFYNDYPTIDSSFSAYNERANQYHERLAASQRQSRQSRQAQRAELQPRLDVLRAEPREADAQIKELESQSLANDALMEQLADQSLLNLDFGYVPSPAGPPAPAPAPAPVPLPTPTPTSARTAPSSPSPSFAFSPSPSPLPQSNDDALKDALEKLRASLVEKTQTQRRTAAPPWETERITDGPWVPETVAGPSDPSRREKKKPREEEYDGMLWGPYT